MWNPGGEKRFDIDSEFSYKLHPAAQMFRLTRTEAAVDGNGGGF
jgi:hypothetical protein